MPRGYRKDGTKLTPPSQKGVKGRVAWNKGTKGLSSNGMKGKKFTDEEKKRRGYYSFKPPSQKGKKRSDITKQKLALSHLGKKPSLRQREVAKELWTRSGNPNWKGGITPINQFIRTSREYKIWRVSVFERDNYQCVWCGTKDAPFNADHIKPFAFYPELRFAIDNGRTLCVPCHKTTDTYGNRYKFKGIKK